MFILWMILIIKQVIPTLSLQNPQQRNMGLQPRPFKRWRRLQLPKRKKVTSHPVSWNILGSYHLTLEVRASDSNKYKVFFESAKDFMCRHPELGSIDPKAEVPPLFAVFIPSINLNCSKKEVSIMKRRWLLKNQLQRIPARRSSSPNPKLPSWRKQMQRSCLIPWPFLQLDWRLLLKWKRLSTSTSNLVS